MTKKKNQFNAYEAKNRLAKNIKTTENWVSEKPQSCNANNLESSPFIKLVMDQDCQLTLVTIVQHVIQNCLLFAVNKQGTEF